MDINCWAFSRSARHCLLPTRPLALCHWGRQAAEDHSPLSLQGSLSTKALTVQQCLWLRGVPPSGWCLGFALSQTIKHYLISCMGETASPSPFLGLSAKRRPSPPIAFFTTVSREDRTDSNKRRALQLFRGKAAIVREMGLLPRNPDFF